MTDPYPNPGNALDALIEGWAAGHFSIPDRVAAAHTGLEALRDEQRASQRPMPGLPTIRAAGVNELVATAVAGSLDVHATAKRREAAVDASKAARESRSVIAHAVGKAADRLLTLITGSAAEIVAEHLRPAFDETIASVREMLPALGGHVMTLEGIASAPQAARTAFLAVLPLMDRHQAIRRAQKGVRRSPAQYPSQDAFGYLLDTRLWPEIIASGVYLIEPRVARRPGPATALERLLWLAEPSSLAWLPTPAEQDAAWAAVQAAMADPNHTTRPIGYATAAAAIAMGGPS